MADDKQKQCFVIMPFGQKENIDGELLDFDDIYQRLIKPSIEALDIECIRCDEIIEAGWIHAKMFKHIYESEVALVDITSLNPNVFYELGVRHALIKSVTIIIRKRGTRMPYNIQGLNIMEYDYNPQDSSSIEESKERLITLIKNSIKRQKNDSPVYEVLDITVGSTIKFLNKTKFYLSIVRTVFGEKNQHLDKKLPPFVRCR